MSKITPESKLLDVLTAPELQSVSRFLMYSPIPAEGEQAQQMAMTPIKYLQAVGWSPESICEGVNFLIEEISGNRAHQLFIYSEKEKSDDPQMGDVNLIHLLTENPDVRKPFIILAAGGAYNTVCTLVEPLPTAVHFVQAGYSVFLLTYRVATAMAAPKALEDLSAAVAYVRKHAQELGVSADRYAVGGFSAGANLISNYGVPSLGYQAHGLPKPLMLMPIYPFVDLKAETVVNGFGDIFQLMFGDNNGAYVEKYNVIGQIDADYPPCYLVCGKDDTTVPPEQSEKMKTALDKAGVPAVLEQGAHAPHGFGDGTGTDVKGWPERAIAFLEQLAQDA